MALTLRRARPGEAAELTALILASKRSNGYDDSFMAACADELSVSEDDILTKQIWVADHGRLMGCVTLIPTPPTGEISSFFIHPEAKRQGVGRTLWEKALTEAQAAELTHLHLDADPEAVPFYEAMGFTTTGQTPSGSIPGRFLPKMERQL